MEARLQEPVELSLSRQLDAIFKPESVAVIGASNNRERWGHGTLRSVIKAGFRGKIYPVNPKEKVIQVSPPMRAFSMFPDRWTSPSSW
jgi:acetyltransferase